LISIGKTKEKYINEGITKYLKRLKFYTQFDSFEIPNIKSSRSLSNLEIVRKEGELILKLLHDRDYLVILDDKGNSFTSIQFSDKLHSWMLSSKKRLVFVIGGAYGFSDKVYQKGDEILSLSKMTFSHQMARLFFLEQIYRSYTILNKEPYHNE
jgi:23S rRNA (pseudouridine1915-N3)-methyltransferase